VIKVIKMLDQDTLSRKDERLEHLEPLPIGKRIQKAKKGKGLKMFG
jgi:hypothetical protein